MINKYFTKAIVVVLCFAIPEIITAQALTIGDTLPDLTFRNVIHYKSDSLNLQGLRRKLIILDFWSHNCPGCIEDFPFIDSLQRRFNDEIQIVLVNIESKDSTERFLSFRKNIKTPSVPMITGDSLLNRLFPHGGVPHHVWIDSMGIVKNIPQSFHTSFNNISRYLHGNILRFPVENRPTARSSLIDERYEKFVGYFSYLSRCIDAGSVKLVGFDTDSCELTSLRCTSAQDLYRYAFSEFDNGFFGRPQRFQLLAKDAFKYIRPTDPDSLDNFIEHYEYYYQLLVPKSRAKFLYKYMQADLSRFFDLSAKIEYQDTRCLTLVRTDQRDHLVTKGGVSLDNFLPTAFFSTEKPDSIRVMKNFPFKKLRDRLQSLIENMLHIPFQCDLDFNENIDIQFPGSAMDSFSVSQISKHLRPYGLDLVYKTMKIPVLVLRDKDLTALPKPPPSPPQP